MEVNFIPENDEEEETFFDGLVTEQTHGREYVLRMSWLLRYPKNPGTLFRPRFAAMAHPNLSPLIVAEETTYFLDIIYKMLQTK